MARWQVVEKEAFGVDWAPARFGDLALMRYNSAEEAEKAAKQYVTEQNIDNALTAESKVEGLEAFYVDEKGVFLGVLDNKEWYLTYPKDVVDKNDKTKIAHRKGDVVKNKDYYLLDGKAEVTIREVPGT